MTAGVSARTKPARERLSHGLLFSIDRTGFPDLPATPPKVGETSNHATKLGVRLSGMRGQRIRELAAIFQRQHGLDALRMAEERRDEHVPKSEGFRLWDAITRELRQLLSRQLNQPLNPRNAALRQETTPTTIARLSGPSSGGKSDSEGK